MAIRIADVAADIGLSHHDFISWGGGGGFTEEERVRFQDPNALVDESEVPRLTTDRFGVEINWMGIPGTRCVTRWGALHFKSLNDQGTFPLRNITLIVGPNSSGKSSVLESILWIGHACVTEDLDVRKPRAAFKEVDLGGFENTIYRHSRKRGLTFSFDLHPRILEDGIDYHSPLRIALTVCHAAPSRGERRLKGKDARGKSSSKSPGLVEIRIEADNRTILRARKQSEGNVLKVVSCDPSHPMFGTLFKTIWEADPDDKFATKKLTILRKLMALCLRHQGLAVRGIDTRMAFKSRQVSEHLASLLSRYHSKERRALSEWARGIIGRFCIECEGLLESVSQALRKYTDSGCYLGAALGAERDACFDTLFKDDEILAETNTFLERLNIPFRLSCRRSRKGKNGIRITDLRNGTTVLPSAVGSSFNQVVSLLVALLKEHKNRAERTFLMEEAFRQLHPAAQAEMGDVLIQCALGDYQHRFVVETHSEHLILRLLRRIRQTHEKDPSYPDKLPKITPHDVSIVYAQPTKNGTKLRHLEISPEGRFLDDWPDGFFTERMRELL